MQGTILGFTKGDTGSLDSLSSVFAGSWSKSRTSIDYRKGTLQNRNYSGSCP